MGFVGAASASMPQTPIPGHPCVPNSASYYMQCAGNAPGKPVTTPGFSLFGVDSYGASNPGINAAFDCSYVPIGSKGWTFSGIQNWVHAGKHVCFVWESYATRAEYGYGAGRSDAFVAAHELAQLGVPAYVPIRFAVDTPASEAAVESYFQGAKSAIGARTGAYGSFYVTSGLEAKGITTPTTDWQTVAWSNSNRGRSCLYQSSINHIYQGSSVDFDDATCANYGQYPFKYVPLIVCFGPKAAGSKTCRKAHAQVRKWERAEAASQRVFKHRSCAKLQKTLHKLNQRWNWYWLQLTHHPGVKTAKRKAAEAATYRARAKVQKLFKTRACLVFGGRVSYFRSKIKSLEAKYGSNQKAPA